MDDSKNLQETKKMAIGCQNSLTENTIIPSSIIDTVHCNYDFYEISNEFTIKN